MAAAALTKDELDLVEASFSRIGPVTAALGLSFYDRLFQLDPTSRALFPAEMSMQALKLMQVLSFCVSNLREPEKLLPAVRDLGRKHVGFGVEARHYETVETALLHTLRASLGDAWTTDVETAWGKAYRSISSEMKTATELA